MSWHARPVSGQDVAAERVYLNLADDAHAGALQAQVYAADAGEQGQDVHAARGHRTTTPITMDSARTMTRNVTMTVMLR